MKELYTDGACSGNPGPGGWAWVLVENGVAISQGSGFDKNTTNNRMELIAVIEGLTKLLNESGSQDLCVYTDSTYVQQGITAWIKKWKLNGWRTASKGEVKNKDLWQTLDGLQEKFTIQWNWVKGHAHNEFNNLCDSLAVQAYRSNM